MKVQNISINNYRNKATQNHQNKPSFGGAKEIARTAFEKAGEYCNVDSRNGSLSRAMFFAVATLFLLGGRFVKSRSGDERREVVTRDVPAIALSVAGAPLLNKAMAYAVTQKTGVPIVTLDGAKNFMNASFTSQKQLIDWYSNLGKDATVNFVETVNKHGGDLQKVFKKLGFTDKLKAITDATDNKGILNAIKNAQANNTEAFQSLETAMKSLGENNGLLKFAKKSQAYVKLAGIGLTAAILGFFLPRLNIIVTRNKYKKQLEAGKIDQATYEKKLMRTYPVLRPSSGVLSFHKSSAVNTFRNMFAMFEQPQNKQ